MCTCNRIVLASVSLTLVATLLHCAPSAPTRSSSPGPPEAGSSFDVLHEGFGFRANLDGWRIYQSASEAPQQMRIAFAAKNSPDDPPLFLAVRGGSVLTASVMPNLGIDAVTFFQLLSAKMAGQADFPNAQTIAGTQDVLYRGRVNAGIAIVDAYGVIRSQDGHIVHVALNGEASSIDVDALFAAIEQVELRSGTQWSSPWLNLRSPVAGDPIPGFVALGEPSQAHDATFVPVHCSPGQSPLLWRAPTPKGQIFLFGSIHMGHPSFYPFPASIEAAFEGASRLVVEVDLGNSDALTEAAANQGPTVSELLDADEFARVVAFSERYGLPEEALDTMGAGMAAATLSLLPYIAQGFDPNAGVDLYFLGRAEDHTVIELESIQEQMALFSDVAETLLHLLLDELDHADADVGAMHAAWKCGDEAALTEMLLALPVGPSDDSPETLSAIEAFHAAFIDDRNASMAKSIAALANQSGDTFVVIGAAHLIGEQGVPALLRQSGLQFELVAP